MYEIGFRGGLFTLIYMPYMLSGLALGFMAIMLFSDATGTANQLLMELGIIDKSINIKSSAGVTIGLPILVGWQFAGWNMAIFLSGLLSIPTDTIEAAIVDGASYIQRLRYVYFPQMVPSLVIVGSFALMGSFQIFDILIPLGALMGNNAAEFLSIVIFRYGFSANKLSLALAISVETLLPLMIVVIFLNWLQRRLSYET
jgi:ABC-type sugar transport system permease subunit